MKAKQTIDRITQEFFHLFTTKDNTTLNLDHIHDLCISDAMIIKNVSGQTEVYDLKSFITPRKKLLTDGTLTDFSEYEIQERTDIFGHIAQRFCIYEKSGKLKGKPFTERGMKTFQFILTMEGWRISSLAWDDESNQHKVDVSLT